MSVTRPPVSILVASIALALSVSGCWQGGGLQEQGTAPEYAKPPQLILHTDDERKVHDLLAVLAMGDEDESLDRKTRLAKAADLKRLVHALADQYEDLGAGFDEKRMAAGLQQFDSLYESKGRTATYDAWLASQARLMDGKATLREQQLDYAMAPLVDFGDVFSSYDYALMDLPLSRITVKDNVATLDYSGGARGQLVLRLELERQADGSFKIVGAPGFFRELARFYPKP